MLTINHRGPFRLHVVRPDDAKPSFFTSEWLKGEELQRDDVEETARALLTDPRDTVTSIDVWSVSEQQFVTSLRFKDVVLP